MSKQKIPTWWGKPYQLKYWRCWFWTYANPMWSIRDWFISYNRFWNRRT